MTNIIMYTFNSHNFHVQLQGKNNTQVTKILYTRIQLGINTMTRKKCGIYVISLN